MKKTKLVVDENIPLAEALFSRFGEVCKRAGRAIVKDDIRDAELLLVRSVTRVDKNLLAGTPIKFVGTCTIGEDHLDKDYLDSQGITYTSAPGCNAFGVVQYVLSVMALMDKLDTTGSRIGILGHGNIGGHLRYVLDALGFDVVYCDPFLPDDLQRVALETLCSCDIISCHTPLTRSGPHPTYGLFDEELIAAIQPGTTLISAGRGGVLNESALLSRLLERQDISVALDVWFDEPNINRALLNKVNFATPHIAGYSYEGKVNGSTMVYEKLAKFMGMDDKEIQASVRQVKSAALGQPEALPVHDLKEAILHAYDVRNDDAHLRAHAASLPGSFDMLRKTYPLRREFSHYIPVSKTNKPFPQALGQQFSALGFQLASVNE